MAIYKYVTARTAIRILEGSIRFTQPGAFNDPFELLPQFIPWAGETEGENVFSFCLFSPARKGIDRRGKVDDDLCSDHQARLLVQDFNNKIGMLCLSRNRESLLMWAHYAESYAGAIIEFDEQHDFFEGLHNIKYKKRRPLYDINDFLERRVPIADLCTKPSAWAYEKEARLFRSFKNLADSGRPNDTDFPVMTMDVPQECIKGVIMGERMNITSQKEIWNLVKRTPIGLEYAAIDGWDYQFRYEPIKFEGPLRGSPIMTPRTANIFVDEKGDLGEIARQIADKHKMSNYSKLKI